jgi:hypothetical protein
MTNSSYCILILCDVGSECFDHFINPNNTEAKFLYRFFQFLGHNARSNGRSRVKCDCAMVPIKIEKVAGTMEE